MLVYPSTIRLDLCCSMFRAPSNLLCAVIRRTLLTAHRQAWCWQDEWVGLDLAAVRQLESETRMALARVMQEAAAAGSSSPTPNAPNTGSSPKKSPKASPKKSANESPKKSANESAKKSAKESAKESATHKAPSGADLDADGQLHSQDTSNGALS